MADEDKATTTPAVAKKAVAAPEPDPVRLTFRTFAASLDVAMANALRVRLGLAKSDIDQVFSESDLQAALDELNGKETVK